MSTDGEVWATRSALRNGGTRETDVEVRWNGGALLIEDKIDSSYTSGQPQSYVDEVELRVRNGGRAAAVLVCPDRSLNRFGRVLDAVLERARGLRLPSRRRGRPGRSTRTWRSFDVRVLRQRAWERAVESVGVTSETRDMTRVDGSSAGNFVPPHWLLDQVGAFPRAGRLLADLVTPIPLPAGTDSVSVPRFTTGAGTAIQVADNAAVQETDPADAAVTGPVRTIAGHVDASLQLVDQSGPPGFDRLVYADLLADYDAKLEGQIVAGSGASGQIAGLLGAAATNVTYTSAIPTVAGTLSKVGDLAAQVSTARQRLPSVAVMAPRRGFWG